MSLDIKKVYVDTRWRTSDSKSSTDFSIELPRSFTVPDNVVAYIDDIVLPISFPTIYDRNNTLYFEYAYNTVNGFDSVAINTGNYTGATFSEALKNKLNAWAQAKFGLHANVFPFDVTYNVYDNSIELNVKVEFFAFTILSDDDLQQGYTSPGFTRAPISNPKTINKVLQLNKTANLYKENPFHTFLDLHTTRNLYLTSSTLCAYNSISNFGNDTIIKKIPIKAGYNEMLYHDSGSGFDTLDITPRTLRYIDFKLVHAYFDIVDLRGNRWSFSIIFAQK